MAADVLEERKDKEKLWYERRYGTRIGLDSATIRQGILGASENHFRARLEALSMPGVRVLEIGAGEGKHSILSAMKGAHVTGIDISENAVTAARENAIKAGVSQLTEFRVADVEKLPFEDNSFDLVVDHEVLSSVLLSPVIKESARVLRPGGIFLGIECFGHNPLFNLNRSLKALTGERTAWAVSHILTEQGVLEFEREFAEVRVTPYHLFSAVLGVPALVLPPKAAKSYLDMLEYFDREIFKSKYMRRYAFKVIVEATARG